MPGLLRAYGDRELFRRFRWRFILVPLVLVPVCGMFFFDQLVGMKLVVLAWGVWHFLMQTYGFARIYDMKAGNDRDAGRRLDEALDLHRLDLLARHQWQDGGVLDLFEDVDRGVRLIEEHLMALEDLSPGEHGGSDGLVKGERH